MNFIVPKELEAQLDEIAAHYPEKRSATLMFLHALQEHFHYISQEAVEWTAKKLNLKPINVYELVTFYPMFRQEPLGTYHIKVCRTLSCALNGSHEIRDLFCRRLGLDPNVHGPQTTGDGRFTVEFVECLASCGTAPVLMVNDTLVEHVTPKTVDELLSKCK